MADPRALVQALGGGGMTAGIGGHHSPRAITDEWLTPPEVLAALGPFDLDPCAPIVRPWPMAAEHYTIEDNGLSKPWHGRVWLNPPYGPPSVVGPWLARMAEHGRGIALIFARTETEVFFRHVWGSARALLFLRGRLHFHRTDGSRAKNNSGAPSVLIAYGAVDAHQLAACGLAGAFIPLAPHACLGVAA
jgi:hypothetical protein